MQMYAVSSAALKSGRRVRSSGHNGAWVFGASSGGRRRRRRSLCVRCGGVFRSMSVRVRAVNDFRSGRPGREMKGGLNGTGSGVMCDATSIQQTKLMMTDDSANCHC